MTTTEGLTQEQLAQKVRAKTISADLVDNTDLFHPPAVKAELDVRGDAFAAFAVFPRTENDAAIRQFAFAHEKHSDFVVIWPTGQEGNGTTAVLIAFKPVEQYPSRIREPWNAGLSLALTRHSHAVVVRQQGSLAKVTLPYQETAYYLTKQGGRLDLSEEELTREVQACQEAKTRVELRWAEVEAVFDQAFAAALQKPYTRTEWLDVREQWEINGFMPLADGPPKPFSMAALCSSRHASLAIPSGNRWVLASCNNMDARGMLVAIGLWDQLHQSILVYPNQNREAGPGFWMITRGEEERTEMRRMFVTLSGEPILRTPMVQLDLEVLNEHRGDLPPLEDYEQLCDEAEQSDLEHTPDSRPTFMA